MCVIRLADYQPAHEGLGEWWFAVAGENFEEKADQMRSATMRRMGVIDVET